MSKTSRSPRRAAGGLRGPALTKLRQPSDIIAMIPYIVGFMPADSLVLIALEGDRQRFGPCLRLDLCDDARDAPALTRYLLDVVEGHHFRSVLVVAFSVDAGAAESVVDPLLRGLRTRGIRVVEALRADGQRWWSYVCTDPVCCSPAGTEYDADSSWVAAEAVVAGLHRLPDRDSLRRQFEPASPDARQEVAAACRGLRRDIQSGRRRPPDVADMDRLLASHLGDPDAMPITVVAEILLVVQQIDLRDAAWSLMSRANAASHFLLWRRVMRLAPDDLMAPAGALTGFAAWLDGRGVDASHAVERVFEVSAGYPMCGLLREILDATVNPEIWDRFPLLRDPAS